MDTYVLSDGGKSMAERLLRQERERESARIRRELLDAIESETVYVQWIGNRSYPVDEPFVEARALRGHLDRVCPPHDDSTSNSPSTTADEG